MELEVDSPQETYSSTRKAHDSLESSSLQYLKVCMLATPVNEVFEKDVVANVHLNNADFVAKGGIAQTDKSSSSSDSEITYDGFTFPNNAALVSSEGSTGTPPTDQGHARWTPTSGQGGGGEGADREGGVDLRDPRSPILGRSPSFLLALASRESSSPPTPPSNPPSLRYASQGLAAWGAGERTRDLQERPLPYPAALLPADHTEPGHGSSNTSILAPRPSCSFNSDSSVCRICHEGESREDLVSPCYCAGSLGKLHLSCLERWLGTSNSTHCEICQYQFKVERKPRPLIEFFLRPSTVEDRKNLIYDIVCFVVLTPLTCTSLFLCLMGLRHYMQMNSRWEVPGLASLITCLTMVYLIWCLVAVRHHYQVCRQWQRENQTVKILYLSPKVGHTSFSTSAILGPLTSNNNAPVRLFGSGQHSYLNPAFSASNSSRQNVTLLSYRPIVSPSFPPSQLQRQSQSTPMPLPLPTDGHRPADHAEHLRGRPQLSTSHGNSLQESMSSSSEANHHGLNYRIQGTASSNNFLPCLDEEEVRMHRSPSQISDSTESFATACSSPEKIDNRPSPSSKSPASAEWKMPTHSSSLTDLLGCRSEDRGSELPPIASCSRSSFPQAESDGSISLWSRLKLHIFNRHCFTINAQHPFRDGKETSV